MIDLDIKPETDADAVMDLLMLADPSEALVRDYVAEGKLYKAIWDDIIVGVFVLLPLEDTLWELKNIAVSEEWQGKGVGKVLLNAAVEAARVLGATTLEVGTGNSSVDQLAYYQKAGFRMVRIARNFFTLNYDEPIIENGIPCVDMVILSRNL